MPGQNGLAEESEMPTFDYCIFEYQYRDASNYKARGQVLLDGSAKDDDLKALRAKLESGEFFIPEQVGIQPLQPRLWAACGCAPDVDLDHCWHEFEGLRDATAEDLAEFTCWGTVASFVATFREVGEWDVTCSKLSTQ